MDSDCKGGSSISSSKMKQGKHHQLTKFFSIKTMPKRAQKSDEPTNKVAPVMKKTIYRYVPRQNKNRNVKKPISTAQK